MCTPTEYKPSQAVNTPSKLIFLFMFLAMPLWLSAQNQADYAATILVGGILEGQGNYVELGGGLRNYRPGPNPGTSFFYHSSVLIPLQRSRLNTLYGIKPGFMYHGLFNTFSAGLSFLYRTDFSDRHSLAVLPEIGIGTGAWRIFGGIGIPVASTERRRNNISQGVFGVQILVNVKQIEEL